MKKLRDKKGITMASLVIAVAVLLILTSIIIVNIGGEIKIEKLDALQNDIDNLRDKISLYYGQYGDIPARGKYPKSNYEHIDSISRAVDTGDFLVIDLEAIENLTLNYGQDYENVKNLEHFKNNQEITSEEALENMNLYIINSTSHNIFYVKGIEVDGKMYYTDYLPEEKDIKPVELHTSAITRELPTCGALKN